MLVLQEIKDCKPLPKDCLSYKKVSGFVMFFSLKLRDLQLEGPGRPVVHELETTIHAKCGFSLHGFV